MAGMRAANRGASPDQASSAMLRACLDLVEHSLTREPAKLTAADIGTTLTVLEQASSELSEEPTTAHGVATALQNACKRLRLLMADLEAS